MPKSTRKLWAEYVARGGKPGGSPAQAVLSLPVPFKGVVLGIDPSLRGSGFAVIDYRSSSEIALLESATLKLKPVLSQIECLGAIGNQVEDFIDQHRIQHVAIEETIYVQNFQTAQILGAARGAAIAVAAMRGLPVFEYAPLRIKQAVVGPVVPVRSRWRARCRMTGHDWPALDESDAAAVALCHAFTWREGGSG